ncbi:hypothetical protein HO133_000407 [Letharia lupina]|uniref:CDP-diacylglycerol--glycerol-3-phosphate 3-phosphatidyltransferase n=1 Tax=Letharia lupina TaxID=560253 RepID=A0A8H6FD78_9LECA|nr:uncharacterized protein HO133_000407 [Letharia lupina]KAF6223564.1 hypothetical protein HO133_000407 [Letharia lupina]
MLVRRIRANPRPWLPSSTRRLPWQLRLRAHSTTSTLDFPQTSTHASPLAALTSDLDRLAPRIDINADQIEILDGPTEFYERLRSKIRRARRRIYLSTLYIGKTENELISTIRDALLQQGSELKVSILTDALRGTREAPNPSCASLLASLVEEFPDRVEVRMYHTPNLTGLRKALIPKRINEGWGLQHIKLYGIDDEVILSGANLSNDYFTNRQDRYHVFSSKRVADYFARIHDAVCSISFLLRPRGTPSKFTLEWPTSSPAPNPLEAPKGYIEAATSLLLPFVKPASSQSPPTTSTSVYPVICHPPTINTELPAFTALLARHIKSYIFTAGYFNPHPVITSSLLAASSLPISAPGSILTASPYANGFFGSKGISGLLPAAYTHLSLRFLQAARGKNIQLREWQRGIVGQQNGWTYHAKGLWVTLQVDLQQETSSSTPNKTSSELSTNFESKDPSAPAGPSVTLIGSSNYTTRSYGLDLEVGAIVVTKDEGLMRKLKREGELLMTHTNLVKEEDLETKERKAGWKVRVAMWLVKVLGGAL